MSSFPRTRDPRPLSLPPRVLDPRPGSTSGTGFRGDDGTSPPVASRVGASAGERQGRPFIRRGCRRSRTDHRAPRAQLPHASQYSSLCSVDMGPVRRTGGFMPAREQQPRAIAARQVAAARNRDRVEDAHTRTLLTGIEEPAIRPSEDLCYRPSPSLGLRGCRLDRSRGGVILLSKPCIFWGWRPTARLPHDRVAQRALRVGGVIDSGP